MDPLIYCHIPQIAVYQFKALSARKYQVWAWEICSFYNFLLVRKKIWIFHYLLYYLFKISLHILSLKKCITYHVHIEFELYIRVLCIELHMMIYLHFEKRQSAVCVVYPHLKGCILPLIQKIKRYKQERLGSRLN